MASIAYQYISFEFKRRPLQPLSELEYLRVQKNFDQFLDDFLERAEVEFKSQKNPHSFRRKTFLILLGTGGAFIGIDFLLKALGYSDAGEVFAVLAFIPLAAIFLQPVQWFLSFIKSSSFDLYEKKARAYYCFQESKVKGSADYVTYLKKLLASDEDEFETFKYGP